MTPFARPPLANSRIDNYMKKHVLRNLTFKQFLTELKEHKNRYLLFCFLFLFLLLLPGQSYYQTLELVPQERKFLDIPFAVPTPALYPQKIGQEQEPIISAPSAVVLDLDSQVVLLAKNPQTKLLPASTTKIMTALVVLSQWKPTVILTVPEIATQSAQASEGALMGLKGEEKVTVQSLLYGLLLNSGTDAAYTLSMNYPASQSAFINAMNNKAKELHLTNTHFQNEVGFDDKAQYTTVLDLGRVTALALKKPVMAKSVSTKAITVIDVDQKNWYHLENLNKLLWNEQGTVGVKTGYTELAGDCLVAEVERNGHHVLTVVLKSEDRFADSQKLIDWTYRNFQWTKVQANF